MTILTLTETDERLNQLIRQTTISHEPLLLQGNQSNAVLLSEEDWQAIQETLYLLGIPGMRDSILEGMATPVEECSTEVEW